MKKGPSFALLSLLITAFFYSGVVYAQVEILDDFNRANGPIAGKWIEQQGLFHIVDNAAQGGEHALAVFGGRESSNVVEADVEATGSGIQYVALVLGFRDVANNYFMKIQDNDGETPDFSNLYCYYGGNSSFFWGSNQAIPLNPPFRSAHMKAEFQPLTRNVTITFSHIDGGSGEQQYSCPDAPLTGGSGIGIGSYTVSLGKIDNFSVSGAGPLAVPAVTPAAAFLYVIFSGAGAIFFLTKFRRHLK